MKLSRRIARSFIARLAPVVFGPLPLYLGALARHALDELVRRARRLLGELTFGQLAAP